MKYLYKYPQSPYPYGDLIETSRRRGRNDWEYELLDTGIFNEDRYFDVFVECAKATPTDILIQISLANRGPEAASIHVLPTLWFRSLLMLALWSCGRRAGVVQAQLQIHRAFAGQLRRRLRTSSHAHADPPYPLAPPRKIGRNKSDEAVGVSFGQHSSYPGCLLPGFYFGIKPGVSCRSAQLLVVGAGVACSV
jgi:hypothetical protein